jgi:hypothetical protein
VKAVPTPPQTPPAGDKKEAKNADEAVDQKANVQNTNGTTTSAGTKRPADDTPLSPALSGRQGSIRRLFSRTVLNNNFVEGDPQTNGNGAANGARPASRSDGSLLDEKKAKRGSGWFRRLRTGDTTGKRSSLLYEDAKKPAGPPPPMIPELSDLEAKVNLQEEGSLGSDLFKNIK